MGILGGAPGHGFMIEGSCGIGMAGGGDISLVPKIADSRTMISSFRALMEFPPPLSQNHVS